MSGFPQPPPGFPGMPGAGGKKPGDDKKKTKKRFEPKGPSRIRKRKNKGPTAASKLPKVYPTVKCKLRQLKLERIKDFLLMEEEYIQNQEVLKPAAERDMEERAQVEEIRGSPLQIGTLEELIDDNHAIVSTTNGPQYYVSIMSFVDRDLLEPNATVLLHATTQAVVGLLTDDSASSVSVMKVDKAPTESYGDIGGLEKQIQEI